MRPTLYAGCSALAEADGTVVRWFDGSSLEKAIISLSFPSGWSGILKFRVSWKSSTADAGNVFWYVQTENAVNGEVMAGLTYCGIPVSAAGGTQYMVSVTDVSPEFTVGVDGDRIDLYLTRQGAHATDTYDGHDAGAFLLEVFYLMYSDGIEEV